MLLAVCGFKGSGKDWVCSFFAKYHGFKIYKFSKPIKDIIKTMFPVTDDILEGRNQTERIKKEEKSEVIREILKKDFSCRDLMLIIGEDMKKSFGKDIWVNMLDYQLKIEKPEKAIISDLRLREEYEWLRRNNGKIIRVTKYIPEWIEYAKLASSGDHNGIKKMEELNIHRTEYEWISFPYIHEIKFNGSLEDLENQIKNFKL